MSSTVKITGQFNIERGGQAECGWMQNHCTKCGWSGKKHYAYNDYQHSNCREERAAHRCRVVENCARLENIEEKIK